MKSLVIILKMVIESTFGCFLISCSSLNTGLIGYYPFNSNVNDLSGNNNGKVNNATLTYDRFGTPNSCYIFNGIDNSILLPNEFDTLPRSINLWFNPNKSNYKNSYGAIFQYDYPKQLYGNIGMAIKDIDNKFQLLLTISAITDTIEIQAENWYNVAIVVNSKNEICYYLNGVLIGKKLINKYISSVNGLENAVIGSSRIAANNYFNGSIDDIRIYNRVLKKGEIKKIYKLKNEKKY